MASTLRTLAIRTRYGQPRAAPAHAGPRALKFSGPSDGDSQGERHVPTAGVTLCSM